MRSDVTLYVVAVFFFALTIASAFIFNEAERSLWIVSTAVLGILSVGLGYYQRPKAKVSIQKMQKAPVATVPAESIVQPVSVQVETQSEQAAIIETVPVGTAEIEAARPTVEPLASEEQASIEITQAEAAAAPVEKQVETALTNVKGIGEKRAAQLNSLGINTVEELANASVADVAESLKVSAKIVAKWVEAAKQ